MQSLSCGSEIAILSKGKSGGYRLIYYVQTATGIILLTVYAKSEQINVAAEDLRSIITEYEESTIADK